MKARDLILGWPRGRSTSRPLASELQLYRAGVICVLYESNGMTGMGVDHRWMQDWAADQAEDRRKAEMMGTHYGMQRIEVRGPLYPQPLSEQMFCLYPHGFEIDPETLAYVDKVRELVNWLSGGIIGGTKKP